MICRCIISYMAKISTNDSTKLDDINHIIIYRLTTISLPLMFIWLHPFGRYQKYTGNWLHTNPSGRVPALTLACYASCDRALPEIHPLKMFEILGHPQFKQLHGHKMPMNATNSPNRLNLHIFSLNLSYHSFVSVQDIQQKRLLNKISVYTFTHPGGHHRVANATLFVACTRDGCATFWSPVTSSEVTWFTWSPLWRSTHLPNSEIFIARNNAFFIATAHVVKDAKILG